MVPGRGERRDTMVKRLILGIVVGLIVLTGTASAQDSPAPTVAPTVITAAPTTVAPPTTARVGGVVVNRPLPRTGNDFGVQVLFGSGLTAAGLALAVTARIRRQRLLTPAS